MERENGAMTYVCLSKPLERHLVRRVVHGPGSSRTFTMTFTYRDGHGAAHRSHTWSVAEGEDTQARESTELSRFRLEMETWLAGQQMRLVDGDSVPVLAPISDGA
jgi:hypothetical protein